MRFASRSLLIAAYTGRILVDDCYIDKIHPQRGRICHVGRNSNATSDPWLGRRMLKIPTRRRYHHCLHVNEKSPNSERRGGTPSQDRSRTPALCRSRACVAVGRVLRRRDLYDDTPAKVSYLQAVVNHDANTDFSFLSAVREGNVVAAHLPLSPHSSLVVWFRTYRKVGQYRAILAP